MSASAVMSAVVTSESGGPTPAADSTNGDQFRAVADALGSGDGSDAPEATDGDVGSGRLDELSSNGSDGPADVLSDASSSALVIAAAVARTAVQTAGTTPPVADPATASGDAAAGSDVIVISAVVASASSDPAATSGGSALAGDAVPAAPAAPATATAAPAAPTPTATHSGPPLDSDGSASSANSGDGAQEFQAPASSATPTGQDGDPTTEQRGPRSMVHSGLQEADVPAPVPATGDQVPVAVTNAVPVGQSRAGSPTGTEAAVASTVRPPVNDDPNIARLTGIARSVVRGGGSHAVSITLTPGDLGSVRVEVSTGADGRVSVHLAAEQAAGAHALRNATSALRTSLEADGLVLDQVSVGSGDVGQQAAEPGRQRIFDHDHQDGQGVRPTFGSAAPNPTSATSQPTGRRSSGLDLDL